MTIIKGYSSENKELNLKIAKSYDLDTIGELSKSRTWKTNQLIEGGDEELNENEFKYYCGLVVNVKEKTVKSFGIIIPTEEIRDTILKLQERGYKY